MKQQQKLYLYLRPSFFSASLSFIVIVYMMATSIWSWARNIPVVNQLSDMVNDRSDTIDQAVGSNVLSDTVLSSPIVNEVFYLFSWALVGILAYFGFIVATRGVQGFKELLGVRREVGGNHKMHIHEVILRLMLRLMFLISLIVYLVILLQALLPVASSSFRAGSTLDSANSVQYLLMGAVVVALSFHLLTILMRLSLLRVRVFAGGEDLVLSQIREV